MAKKKKKYTKWADLEKRVFTPEEIEKNNEWVSGELVKMKLAEIRKVRGLTQVKIAELLDIGQGHVSCIERRSDHHVSTLRRMAKAMGAELVIALKFDDKIYQLEDV
jgi:predicted XRE-type DNA-binding protein